MKTIKRNQQKAAKAKLLDAMNEVLKRTARYLPFGVTAVEHSAMEYSRRPTAIGWCLRAGTAAYILPLHTYFTIACSCPCKI